MWVLFIILPKYNHISFYRLLVLIAIQDEGSARMNATAYDALKKVGAKDPLRGDPRSSYALLGWSGPGVPNFVTQVK